MGVNVPRIVVFMNKVDLVDDEELIELVEMEDSTFSLLNLYFHLRHENHHHLSRPFSLLYMISFHVLIPKTIIIAKAIAGSIVHTNSSLLL